MEINKSEYLLDKLKKLLKEVESIVSNDKESDIANNKIKEVIINTIKRHEKNI